jgi:gluconokinase
VDGEGIPEPTIGSAAKIVVIVMGVSGSGKTTIGRILADRLDWSFAEADDLHPAENVAKMTAGTPLTDDDRWPWLEIIRAWIDANPGNAIVTCSALRRSYRDILRTASARVRFLHLHGSVEALSSRLSARTDHFMPAAMLDSQLATLEPLGPDEDGVVVSIADTPQRIADRAAEALGIL